MPDNSKAALRADALAKRRAYARSLTPALRADLEAMLADIVLPRLIGARFVAGYHPMTTEIGCHRVLEGLGGGQIAALPGCADRDARMMFREGPAVEPGPWNLLQPPSDANVVAPDTVLVPLVLGDRRGTRIGHGQGHYDRALTHLREAGPIFTIGIAWEVQISDEPIPADPWDVPLDAIATPREWIACR